MLLKEGAFVVAADFTEVPREVRAALGLDRLSELARLGGDGDAADGASASGPSRHLCSEPDDPTSAEGGRSGDLPRDSERWPPSAGARHGQPERVEPDRRLS